MELLTTSKELVRAPEGFRGLGSGLNGLKGAARARLESLMHFRVLAEIFNGFRELSCDL